MEQTLECGVQAFIRCVVALAKLHEVQNAFVRQGFVHWSCRSSYYNNPARQGNETDLILVFWKQLRVGLVSQSADRQPNA